MRRRQRLLADSTAALYARTLRRVYGDAAPDFVPDLEGPPPMPETVRAVLCAAINKHWERTDPELGKRLVAQIPEGPRVERTKVFPSAEEISRYEAGVRRLPARASASIRVVLGLGFRTEELLTLERSAFDRALSTGRIKVLGKGSKERELPTAKATAAIEALLAATPFDGRRWTTVGDLFGRAHSSYGSRRNVFARYVRQGAVHAGLIPADAAPSETLGWSPHRLRHIFATFMSAAGAPDAVVAAALGHSKRGSVTRTYLHPSLDDLLQFMRET